MPDLTPYLGVLGTLVTVVGGPAMSSMIQNHRTHRLRSSVSETIKLRKELEESRVPAANDHVRELDELLQEQLSALIARERTWLHRRRDWSSLGVVALLLAVGLPLSVWLHGLESWWGQVLFWLLVVFLLAMVMAGIHATLRPSDKTGRTAEAPGSLEGVSQVDVKS